MGAARTRGNDVLVAYFSMEFGVDVNLPIYSGGLGILAGDHLKAAAELGLPLVGVGLLYRGGYFTQGLDAPTAGRPRPTAAIDPEALGLAARTGHGRGRPGRRDGDGRRVALRRRTRLGPALYLLDVDLLTDALYSGDREHRIRQELLLGVGGVRALAALGLEPTVFHVNEGHSAFLAIERARMLVEGGRSSRDALEHVRRVDGLHDPYAGPRGQRGVRRRARRSATRATSQRRPASRTTPCSGSGAAPAPTVSA